MWFAVVFVVLNIFFSVTFFPLLIFRSLKCGRQNGITKTFYSIAFEHCCWRVFSAWERERERERERKKLHENDRSMREDSEPAIRLGSLKTLEGVKLREKKRGRKKNEERKKERHIRMWMRGLSKKSVSPSLFSFPTSFSFPLSLSLSPNLRLSFFVCCSMQVCPVSVSFVDLFDLSTLT